MHDGNSDRRSRGRRGGKREFGGPQDFGSDFGGGDFGGGYGNYNTYENSGRDDNYGGGRRSGGYGSRDGGRDGDYGGGRRDSGSGNGGGYGNRREGGGGGYNSGGGYGAGPGGGGGGGYGGRRDGGGGGGYGGGPGGGGEGGGYRPRRPKPEFNEPVERGPRQSGTVKFFKTDKGFGFITPDEGESDVFVHISAVERSGLASLDSGQRISFETEPDRRGKGPKAVNLQVLAEDDQEADAGDMPDDDSEY